MQLIDLREATNTLNAYSTSIIGKTRLYDKISKPGVPEEIGKIIEKLITNLQAETKGAMIISIMVMEEVNRHSEQIVAGFPTELAELSKALSRNRTATDEANKIILAHKERLQRKEPMEYPIAKAIREFREKHGYRSS
jgi:wyosine [tRNA(Phe)-imidazoG37] synthetase (radical SAM superfamily)